MQSILLVENSWKISEVLECCSTLHNWTKYIAAKFRKCSSVSNSCQYLRDVSPEAGSGTKLAHNYTMSELITATLRFWLMNPTVLQEINTFWEMLTCLDLGSEWFEMKNGWTLQAWTFQLQTRPSQSSCTRMNSGWCNFLHLRISHLLAGNLAPDCTRRNRTQVSASCAASLSPAALMQLQMLPPTSGASIVWAREHPKTSQDDRGNSVFFCRFWNGFWNGSVLSISIYKTLSSHVVTVGTLGYAGVP